ncbi:MAG: ribokinase [SAR202 cluster bacterium]|jgi:ribokinase|nr:ribokinase [SAR202 cluster bacterium]MDP6511712.1 ribokinase [SAR202 cluster bacterium]MDP6716548.1 ribokinase [SAR202 cluster bacterium]
MTETGTPPTIVVLGGINVDLVGSTARMPAPGETVFGEDFHTAPGGKGANQAVAAARLGADVRMVGRVGQDAFGPVLLEGLRREGIDVSGVAEDPDNSSGTAMILLDADKQNYIIAIYGANLVYDETQFEAVDIALNGADVLLMQLEAPLELCQYAARKANELGVTVVWDPAPALDLRREAYRLCDVLTPNQVETEFLTGVVVTDPSSAEIAADRLLGFGVKAVVVKLGEQGAYYATSAIRGHVPSFEVEVQDTVAAGDAFAGAFGIGLSQGLPLEEAVRFGCAAGALAVTKAGAQEAMPTRAEVHDLFNR